MNALVFKNCNVLDKLELSGLGGPGRVFKKLAARASQKWLGIAGAGSAAGLLTRAPILRKLGIGTTCGGD